MTKHSKIGASTCERWWNCPGSVALVETIPPQPPSVYAAEGSRAHYLAEQCLKEGVYPHDRFPTMPDDMRDMVEHVELYLDTIWNDMKEFNVHLDDIKIEQKFHLDHIDPDMFGTNDASIYIFPRKVIVYDFKYGAGVSVDAEDNKQGLFYALGATYGVDYEEVEIVIVQPRAVHKDGPVRRWTVTRAELEAFGEELKIRAEATKQLEAPRRCGPWCRKNFCPALAVCPEVLNQVQDDAMTVFRESGTITLPTPETLSARRLKMVLDGIPLIDAWTKAVWAYAEQKANLGEEVLGYKLVRGREGNRQWIDELTAAAALQTAVGQKAINIFDVPKLLSPAKLEKLDKSLKDIVSGHVTRSEAKVIMVSEDDPRDKVAPVATQVFKELDKLE